MFSRNVSTKRATPTSSEAVARATARTLTPCEVIKDEEPKDTSAEDAGRTSIAQPRKARGSSRFAGWHAANATRT